MSVGVLEDLLVGIGPGVSPLSVEQYHRMVHIGILHDGEPIELIEGMLVHKDRRDQTGESSKYGPRHLCVLNKLSALLINWTSGKSCHLQNQGPIIVSETSEPEPDCCLVRGTPDDYAEEVPRAGDVLAVFEVAYSSLRFDRRTKQRLYASAGIPLYVILNLQDEVIEVFSAPTATESRYAHQTEHRSGEFVELVLSDVETIRFAVEGVL